MDENKLLLLLTLLGVLGGMGIRMSSAFLCVSEGLKAMALLTAGFAIGRALVSLVTPSIAAGRGSRVASLGFFMLFLVGLGYIFAPSNLYPVLRVLHGISSGVAWPSMQALVMFSAPIERRARISSTYFLFGMIGSSVAYIISGMATMLSLYLCTFILAIVSVVLYLIDIRVNEVRNVKSKHYLDVSSIAILASSLSVGMIVSIVDTEITLEFFYENFGKMLGGVLLGTASGLGALMGYLIGKHLLDIKQSLWSLALPALSAVGSALVVVLGGPLTPLGVLVGKASLTWWRSMNLALARGSKTGLKVGLDNFGRNIGTTIASGVVGACNCVSFIVMFALLLILGALSVAGFSSSLGRWRTHHL